MARAVTLPFLRLHPWWSPRWGLHGACSLWAWSCGSSRTLAPLPPHPAAAPSEGGSASRYRRPPCPLDFPSLPSLLSLVGAGVGGGVGGAPSLPFFRRKHVAGTALARGTALVLLLGSGARRVAPVFALPTLRSLPRCPPRRGLHGAFFPWARSCGQSRTLSPPSPLLAALSSGGGAAVRPPLPASPTLGGAEARGGGGASHFPFVALMSQARGAASLCRGGGGGSPRGSRCRPFYPTPALPVVPPPGLARRVPSSGTVVWFVPPPLPPRSAALPSGGGSLVASPLSALPALWGAGLGGGGRCSLFVSPPLHARRRQDVGTTQSRGEALGCCRGGGGFRLGLPALLHGLGPAAQVNRPLLPLGGSRHVSAWCSVSRACSLLCPYLLEEVRTRVETEDEEVRAAGRTYRTPRRLLAPSAALVEGRAPVSAPYSPGGADRPQMNPPSVSPRLCHRTSGASIALGGGRGPGDESARPLCSRHFQRTDTTAPVSGRSEVDTPVGAAGARPLCVTLTATGAGGPVDGATGACPLCATRWVIAREALRMAPQVPVHPCLFLPRAPGLT